ncbi:MAG: hypothetical protein LBS60_08080 [Deltaproteobacteria bacterium]|jgi:hypothetical protein|nr:hypothetical protein [Deltaproteobacteria bacterium]
MDKKTYICPKVACVHFGKVGSTNEPLVPLAPVVATAVGFAVGGLAMSGATKLINSINEDFSDLRHKKLLPIDRK